MEPTGRLIWQTARGGGSPRTVRVLAILIAVAVIATVAALVFDSETRNIAAEIVEDGGGEQTAEIVVGAPLTLIPNVSLTITDVRWSSSLIWRPVTEQRSASSTTTSDPENRFLVVDYDIDNGSNDWLARDGLEGLLSVVSADGSTIDATDLETFRLAKFGGSYAGPLLEMPPNLSYKGSWFFELDSQAPDLKLVSESIGFELRLTDDIRR